MLSTNVFRRIQICKKKKRNTINAINEELELSESDEDFDKFNEYQHIYDGLH